MIFYFKNSVLASIISIFGCGFAMCGFAMFGDEPAGAVFMILLGVAMVLWGRNISQNKAFKTWWKQIEEKNLEPQIAQNMQFAIDVYNKNPQNRTLKKIEALNPYAAEYIRNNLIKK